MRKVLPAAGCDSPVTLRSFVLANVRLVTKRKHTQGLAGYDGLGSAEPASAPLCIAALRLIAS